MYWLLIPASIVASPLSVEGAILRGGYPCAPVYVIAAPISLKAATKGPIGR